MHSNEPLWANTGLTTIGQLQAHIINQARLKLLPSYLWKYDHHLDHIYKGELTFEALTLDERRLGKFMTVEILPIIKALFLTDTKQD